MSTLFLIMHYVDHFWMVNPTFNDHHFQVSWMHLATLLGIGGIYLAFMVKKMGGAPIIAMNDPKLQKSIDHTVT
jgi:hypothetical protein